VEAFGEDGVVLSSKEDEDKDRRVALAEVLGFSAFVLAGGAAVALGLAELAFVCCG
jgi:hypothetical protein